MAPYPPGRRLPWPHAPRPAGAQLGLFDNPAKCLSIWAAGVATLLACWLVLENQVAFLRPELNFLRELTQAGDPGAT